MTSIQTSQLLQQNNTTEMSTLRDRPSEELAGQGQQMNQTLLLDEKYNAGKPGGAQSMLLHKRENNYDGNNLYGDSGETQ